MTLKYYRVFSRELGSLADACSFGQTFVPYYNRSTAIRCWVAYDIPPRRCTTAPPARPWALRPRTLDATYSAHPERFGHRRPPPVDQPALTGGPHKGA